VIVARRPIVVSFMTEATLRAADDGRPAQVESRPAPPPPMEWVADATAHPEVPR
jgi:hypothetical protein